MRGPGLDTDTLDNVCVVQLNSQSDQIIRHSDSFIPVVLSQGQLCPPREGGNAANHPTMHRAVSPNNYLTQNISSAEDEKPYFTFTV